MAGGTRRIRGKADMIDNDQQGVLWIRGAFNNTNDKNNKNVNQYFRLSLTSHVSPEDFQMGYSMTGTVERSHNKYMGFQTTHMAFVRRKMGAAGRRGDHPTSALNNQVHPAEVPGHYPYSPPPVVANNKSNCRKMNYVNGVPQWNEASIQSNDTSSNCSAVTYVGPGEGGDLGPKEDVPSDLLLVVTADGDPSTLNHRTLDCCQAVSSSCPTTSSVVQCCGDVARNCLSAATAATPTTSNGGGHNKPPVILPADLNDLAAAFKTPANRDEDNLGKISETDSSSLPSSPARKPAGACREGPEKSAKTSPAAQAVKNLCKKFAWRR